MSPAPTKSSRTPRPWRLLTVAALLTVACGHLALGASAKALTSPPSVVAGTTDGAPRPTSPTTHNGRLAMPKPGAARLSFVDFGTTAPPITPIPDPTTTSFPSHNSSASEFSNSSDTLVSSNSNSSSLVGSSSNSSGSNSLVGSNSSSGSLVGSSSNSSGRVGSSDSSDSNSLVGSNSSSTVDGGVSSNSDFNTTTTTTTSSPCNFHCIPYLTTAQCVATGAVLNALRTAFPAQLENVWAGSNFCLWKQVQCSLGGVVVLIPYWNLQGTMPAVPVEVAPADVAVSALILTGNTGITGTLDKSWRRLPKLRVLDVTGCSLSDASSDS